MFIMPNKHGNIFFKSFFPLPSKLYSLFKALVRHVQSKGYPNERFELVTNFPRRKLAHLDYDITLQEAGLCPQETVFVQERN